MEVRMTSLRVVTCARDQSLESTQSDWSIKFSKLFWRVAEKHIASHAVDFRGLVLPPPHKRLLTQAPHSFPPVSQSL